MSERTTAASARPTEYEHLRRKKKEAERASELAEIVDVSVGPSRVVCECQFDWASETIRLSYDLDSDRDVARLERLCAANGLAFEQAAHLQGSLVELEYTGERWLPTAAAGYATDHGSPRETFRAELRLLAQALAGSPALVRRGVERVRGLSTTQLVVGVVLVKKVAIVVLLAYLLL